MGKWQVVYTKQAKKDAKKINSAGLYVLKLKSY